MGSGEEVKGIKKELPKGWRWATLKEVCEINPRKRSGFFRDPNAPTSFIPMEAIDEANGCIAQRNSRPYSEIAKGYTFFEEGDILFAKITPCMQNGKSAIAKNLIDGIGFGSTEFHVIRPKPDITKEWIYFFVRTKEFRKEAEDHFEGSAGQQRVPTDFIENYLIPLPPTLDDQIAIANKLERKMAEVETMRQAALRQKEAGDILQDSILREMFPYQKEEKLPEGWKWIELNNLFTIEKKQIDTTNPSFFTLCFIGMENIESNTRKFVPTSNNNGIGESSCYLFDESHILYGKLRPYLNKVYLPHKPGRCAMELLPLKPKNGFTREFVASILQTKIVIEHAVKHSTGGRMPRANINKLRKLKISIPSSHDVRVLIADKIKIKIGGIEQTRLAIEKQLESIGAMPGAILREVFDFGKK